MQVTPIGRVSCPRREAIDDGWGDVVSTITLDDRFGPEALRGLEDFSHLEAGHAGRCASHPGRPS